MIKDGVVLDYVEWCAWCIGGRRRSVVGYICGWGGIGWVLSVIWG